MEKNENPYLILDVPKDATEQQIKSAYRKLALKHHPDRQTTEEDKEAANAIFAKVSAAHAMLTDSIAKRDFDLANRDWDTKKSASAGPTPPPAKQQTASKPTSAPASPKQAQPTPPPPPPPPSHTPKANTSHAGGANAAHKKETFTRSPKPPQSAPSDSTYSGGVPNKHKTETFTRPKKETSKPQDTSYSGGVPNKHKTETFSRPKKETAAPQDTTYSGGVPNKHKTETFTRSTKKKDTTYSGADSAHRKETFVRPKKMEDGSKKKKKKKTIPKNVGGEGPDTSYSFSNPTKAAKKKKKHTPEEWSSDDEPSDNSDITDSNDEDSSEDNPPPKTKTAPWESTPQTAYGFTNLKDPGMMSPPLYGGNAKRRNSTDPLGGSSHSTQSHRRRRASVHTMSGSASINDAIPSGSLRSRRSFGRKSKKHSKNTVDTESTKSSFFGLKKKKSKSSDDDVDGIPPGSTRTMRSNAKATKAQKLKSNKSEDDSITPSTRRKKGVSKKFKKKQEEDERMSPRRSTSAHGSTMPSRASNAQPTSFKSTSTHNTVPKRATTSSPARGTRSPGRLRHKVNAASVLPPPPMTSGSTPTSPGRMKAKIERSKRASQQAQETAPPVSPGRLKPKVAYKRNNSKASDSGSKPGKPVKFHDPFEIYNRVMKEEFGLDTNNPSKKGFLSGKFNGKKKSKTPEPLSVTMKSKTIGHTDGRLEFKTVTKVERPDGTIDRMVQSTIAEPNDKVDRSKLPKDATAEYVNPNGVRLGNGGAPTKKGMTKRKSM